MEIKNFQNNLVFISVNFGFSVDSISKLETFETLLSKTSKIADNDAKQLERVSVILEF